MAESVQDPDDFPTRVDGLDGGRRDHGVDAGGGPSSTQDAQPRSTHGTQTSATRRNRPDSTDRDRRDRPDTQGGPTARRSKMGMLGSRARTKPPAPTRLLLILTLGLVTT